MSVYIVCKYAVVIRKMAVIDNILILKEFMPEATG